MSTPVQGAQSFARSMDILQLISESSVGLSKKELLNMCTLTRPTLYRVIASLETEGLINLSTDNRYRLGGRLVSLARLALAQSDIRTVAAPYLVRLRDVTGETVHLAVCSGDQMVYIDKVESHAVVRMASTVGTRAPFHSTSVGKAFLSAMPLQESTQIIERISLTAMTSFTTTSRRVLQRSLRQAQRLGFVRDDQENEIGIVCFGAAILELPHAPVASISVSVPMFRLAENTDYYSDPLRETVKAISAELGLTDDNQDNSVFAV